MSVRYGIAREREASQRAAAPPHNDRQRGGGRRRRKQIWNPTDYQYYCLPTYLPTYLPTGDSTSSRGVNLVGLRPPLSLPSPMVATKRSKGGGGNHRATTGQSVQARSRPRHLGERLEDHAPLRMACDPNGRGEHEDSVAPHPREAAATHALVRVRVRVRDGVWGLGLGLGLGLWFGFGLWFGLWFGVRVRARASPNPDPDPHRGKG